MGADTKIEWADATINVWEGCTKVSPACKNCYAETNSPVRAMEARVGEALQVELNADGKRRLKMWGTDGFRYETAHWERELRALNRKARENRQLVATGNMVGVQVKRERPRVFINSLSDIFEDWLGPVYRLEDGKPVVVAQSLDDVRTRFFRVAEECTELDLLLLTKRPENVLRMVPLHWLKMDGKWPAWVWIGTTVEDQEHADKRIPELLKVPAKVRFLSVEPLLGKVDLGKYLHTEWCKLGDAGYCDCKGSRVRSVHWIIVGGESGHSARPMDVEWVRKVRDQCAAAGVPFFFKQWGEWAPQVEWSENLGWHYTGSVLKVGKKNAGRVLDGRTWDEVPR